MENEHAPANTYGYYLNICPHLPGMGTVWMLKSDIDFSETCLSTILSGNWFVELLNLIYCFAWYILCLKANS